MNRRATRFVVLVALATATAGCSKDKDKAETLTDPNTMPTRYQTEIIATLREQIFAKNDTTSITGAMISEPALRQTGGGQHYVSCVRYTAHGVYGVTATVERIGYFYGGHLNQLVETSGDECKGVAYRPFSDLDKACIGKGCK